MVNIALLSGMCISPTLHCILRYALQWIIMSLPVPVDVQQSDDAGKNTYLPSNPAS